jgi:hypothetical protein
VNDGDSLRAWGAALGKRRAEGARGVAAQTLSHEGGVRRRKRGWRCATLQSIFVGVGVKPAKAGHLAGDRFLPRLSLTLGCRKSVNSGAAFVGCCIHRKKLHPVQPNNTVGQKLSPMKSFLRNAILTVAFALGGAAGIAAQGGKTDAERSSFTFGGVEYFHRWSKDDQKEFTPHGQENLALWSDMVTINRYRSVKNGEGLAATANAVLETYKGNGAMVLRTDSVPRTTDKPAEYLIAVLFPRPDFIEAVFARFKIVGGIGTSAVYSHREYGKKIGNQMSAWLKANGPSTEKALMSWEGIPLPDAPKK